MSAADLRRLPWGFLAAAGVGILILMALGTWQLHRRDLKHALIARIEAHMTGEPVDWPVALDAWRRGEDVDYLRVRLAGRYRPGPQFHYFNQFQRISGWQLVAVLDSDGGPAVLVDRGFVPDDLKNAPAANVPAGAVQLTGVIRLHQAAKGPFAPDNDAAGNQWFWWDTRAMALAAGLAPTDLPPLVVQRSPQPGDADWPRSVIPGLAEIPDNHLQYAITWYALALVLAVMAFIFARGRLRTPDNQRDAPT